MAREGVSLQQSLFTALQTEHAQRQAALREENERARRDAAAALATVTEQLANAVNDGVADVFNNQRVIETEARELQAQAGQFTKQTARWMGLVSDFDRSLKEVGDFENWVKVMEWDLQAISTSLENAAAVGSVGEQRAGPGAPPRA